MPGEVTLPKRYPLGIFPTPLVEAPRLTKKLAGPRILIKRDDLTGFGFGGNKIRGLEFFIADALAEDADVIVTGAGPQSNHVRASAAAARAAGLDIIAVLHDDRPAESRGNLLLDELLDVELRFTGDPDRAVVDIRIEEVADELRRAGRRPYVIPRGGTSELGAVGYIECVRELREQLLLRNLSPTWLVVTTGACGTHAGLVAGAEIYRESYRILGITVSRPVTECRRRIQRFAILAARNVGHTIDVAEDAILVRDGFIGPGYGVATKEGHEAIRLLAQTEGLFLDPTYTGKTMAGLIAEIASGRLGAQDTIVYLHTGGEPALFA
jgi:D-cysteine desulfhydrase family pyridoxal phosphate-dependent enzyme